VQRGRPSGLQRSDGDEVNDETSGRAFTRVPLKVEVNLRSEDTFFTGFSENISGGGLFVATDAPFVVGTRLTIQLIMMGGSPEDLPVVVRWVRPPGASGGLPAGMGVRFEGLSEEKKTELQEFIDSQMKETLFFDLD
jgi:type IV pilus assembly protein PilZ